MGSRIVVELPNVVRRPTGFYAQLYVPPKLRKTIGKVVLRQSLRTKNEALAALRGPEAVARLKSRLAGLAEKAAGQPKNAPFTDTLAKLIEQSRETVKGLRSDYRRLIAREE